MPLPGFYWDLSICFYTNDPAFVVKHEANIQNAYIFLEAWEFNNKGLCMFHCQETGLTNILLMVMFCMTNCSGFGL
jgi:hypothetical protein